MSKKSGDECEARRQNWRQYVSLSPFQPSYSFCLHGWLEVARSANYISCFEFDLNINIIVYELVTWVAIQTIAEKLFLAGQNSMKTVYDLHKYSTSIIPATLASLFSLAEWLTFLLQI